MALIYLYVYPSLYFITVIYDRTFFSEYARVTKLLTASTKGKYSNGDIKCEHDEKTRHSIEEGINLTKFYLDENEKYDKNEEFDNQFGEGSSGVKNRNLKRKKETKNNNEQFLQNLFHVQVYQFT